MIEKQILGGILSDPSIMDEVADFIKGEWFLPPYDTFWTVLSSLYENNLPIDSVSVLQESQKKGYGITPSFISEIANSISSSANVEYHSKVLYEQYLKKETNNLLAETEKKIKANEDIFEVLDSHTQKALNLTTSKQETGSEVSLTVKTVIDHIERVHSGKPEGMWVDSGYYDLDERTKFMNGEVTIIAARPSMGKTAFALNLARNMAANEWIGICSLEMPKTQLTTRLISTESEIPYLTLITGHAKQEDGTRISRASSKIMGLKIYIDDESAITPIQLRSKAMRMKKRYGIKALFIDYLQLMRAPEYKADRTREIGHISRSLKGLAKDLNLPIIALAQLNRSVEGRTNKMPQLSDLRESGEIEQDADNVFFLYRPEYYGIADYEGNSTENLCIVGIAKNRNGGTGEVPLRFFKNIMKFENITHFE